MKLVFFNRFFHPDNSATSQMLSDLAFHLAATGRAVHVVTTRTPGATASFELVGGVHVHRVAQASFGSDSLVRRAFAYADYYRGARRKALELAGSGDTVIVKTDPPMLSAMIVPLVKRCGARAIVWLQDLFPEVAKEYGIPGMGWPAGHALEKIRNDSLSVADDVVAIGSQMASRVRAAGCVAAPRLHVIHNWADGKAIVPIGRSENAMRTRLALEGKFVVGYSGNLGRVHEFDTLLGAASLLRSRPHVQFALFGRGPRLPEVRERVAREAIGNVRFEAHQERGMLAQSLSVADVHVSILRPPFEGLVHPSKLYGIMAAGRPTIFVGSVTGETARILSDSGAGIAVASGDCAGLAAAVLRLDGDPAERERMGSRARREFEEKYDMPVALRKWEVVLGLRSSAEKR